MRSEILSQTILSILEKSIPRKCKHLLNSYSSISLHQRMLVPLLGCLGEQHCVAMRLLHRKKSDSPKGWLSPKAKVLKPFRQGRPWVGVAVNWNLIDKLLWLYAGNYNSSLLTPNSSLI